MLLQLILRPHLDISVCLMLLSFFFAARLLVFLGLVSLHLLTTYWARIACFWFHPYSTFHLLIHDSWLTYI